MSDDCAPGLTESLTRRMLLEATLGVGSLALLAPAAAAAATGAGKGDDAAARHLKAMRRLISLAESELQKGRMPFAAVITDATGDVVAEAVNTVAVTHDPTDHAEIRALRAACQRIGRSTLDGHDVYALSHPCPMCMTALMLAAPRRLYFALSLSEKNALLTSLNGGVDYYEELRKPVAARVLPGEQLSLEREAVVGLFSGWDRQNKAKSRK